MLFAGIDDTGYNIALFIHILSAFVAFAPAFVHPFLDARTKADGDMTARQRIFGHIAKNGRTIYAPALIVSGLAGFGVAGLSDEVYKMSQGWLIAAIIVWIAMNGVLHAVILPSEKAIAAGDESAQSKLAAGGGIMSVLLLIVLFLMIWKPGL